MATDLPNVDRHPAHGDRGRGVASAALPPVRGRPGRSRHVPLRRGRPPDPRGRGDLPSRHEGVPGRPGGGAPGRLTGCREEDRGDRRFDIALSHASHELPLVAHSLGIRSAYAFDYEFALAQHSLGCRAATRVVVPEAIPQDRLTRLGARARKVTRYPGLKEEYYLSGFAPDPAVLDAAVASMGTSLTERQAKLHSSLTKPTHSASPLGSNPASGVTS